MQKKSLDENQGLFRQRRNLTITSVVALFYTVTNSQLTGLSLNGVGIKLGNPDAVEFILASMLSYFFLRYYSYLVSHKGKGDTYWFKQIALGLPSHVVRSYSSKVQDRLTKSVEYHGYQHLIENELSPAFGPHGQFETIRYGKEKDTYDSKGDNTYNMHVSFPPNLSYKFLLPSWELWHYGTNKEKVTVRKFVNLKHYFVIVFSEIKSIVQDTYYLDYRFPYILYWLALFSLFKVSSGVI